MHASTSTAAITAAAIAGVESVSEWFVRVCACARAFKADRVDVAVAPTPVGVLGRGVAPDGTYVVVGVLVVLGATVVVEEPAVAGAVAVGAVAFAGAVVAEGFVVAGCALADAGPGKVVGVELVLSAICP